VKMAGVDHGQHADASLHCIHCLQRTAASGQMETVKALVEMGGDVHEKGVDGDTLLHLAARHGHAATRAACKRAHEWMGTRGSLRSEIPR
jgi:ankyrin repeat protein